MEKVFCHYFVKLVEGPPPPREAPKTAVTHAKEYIQELRNRTIIHTLWWAFRLRSVSILPFISYQPEIKDKCFLWFVLS